MGLTLSVGVQSFGLTSSVETLRQIDESLFVLWVKFPILLRVASVVDVSNFEELSLCVVAVSFSEQECCLLCDFFFKLLSSASTCFLDFLRFLLLA